MQREVRSLNISMVTLGNLSNDDSNDNGTKQ